MNRYRTTQPLRKPASPYVGRGIALIVTVALIVGIGYLCMKLAGNYTLVNKRAYRYQTEILAYYRAHDSIRDCAIVLTMKRAPKLLAMELYIDYASEMQYQVHKARLPLAPPPKPVY